VLHRYSHLVSVRLVSFVSIVSLSTKIVYTCGEPLEYLIGGEGWAVVFTFVVPSEIHKKEHGRKETYMTKKSIKIKEVNCLIGDRSK